MMPAGNVATLLAAGHLLSNRPDLRTWSTNAWQRWVKRQQSLPPDFSKPQLLVFATLTCLDDLGLHIGVMQLLSSSARRCSVILSLPTVEAARILSAHGRRQEWSALVRIVDEAERDRMLEDLPREAEIAVFPFPTPLPRAVLDGLAANNGADAPPLAEAFVGSAVDYRQWARASEAEGARQAHALRSILTSDARRLGGLPAPPTNDRWRHDGPGWLLETMDRDGGTIDLPIIGPDDELIVRSPRGREGPFVVARQSGVAVKPTRRLRLRMPGRFLTTMAQRLRVEAHMAGGDVVGTDVLFKVPPHRLKPWMLSAFLNRGGGGNAVIRAFAHGVGCRIAYAEDEPERLSEIPVVWGVLRQSDRILAQAKAQSLYFFYVDHAYFGRGHGKSYRITRNSYEAGPVRACPNDRFAAMNVDVLPWRRGGHEIIVCPPTDYFMQAHGCEDWLESTLSTLSKVTDRPITVRVKPRPGETAVPLPQALETAHALVTHSSNVAVEAACLGTPVFVAPGSAAAPVGRTTLDDIEDPAYPDREQWLCHLAYNQFSFDEIRSGEAWRLLLELEERDFV